MFARPVLVDRRTIKHDNGSFSVAGQSAIGTRRVLCLGLVGVMALDLKCGDADSNYHRLVCYRSAAHTSGRFGG